MDYTPETLRNETDISQIIEAVNAELEAQAVCSFDFCDYNIDGEIPLFDEFKQSLQGEQRENDTDSHRWYIIHEDIYKHKHPVTGVVTFLGVRHVGEHKSELQDDSDVMWVPKFYVVEQFVTVGYKTPS